jgi:hypothetical protein
VTATARDDRFHRPPAPDPSWAETAWFGFAVPERELAGTIYPLFRHDLGVCALGVAVWDASAHEPWHARYARRLWHLPIPPGELDDFAIGGLELRCLEPLQTYRLAYRDAERIELELEYRGLLPVHAPLVSPERGHLDQPCRVRGSLRLRGERIEVDGFEMRDRSWGPRDDLRHTRASYSYGIGGPQQSFLAATFALEGEERVIGGFLVRDGEKRDLVGGTRRVLARSPQGFPQRVRLEATDADQRELAVEGECRSRLAEQATPGMFAWMSLVRWSGSDGVCHGQDQEVWSPDTWPVARGEG